MRRVFWVAAIAAAAMHASTQAAAQRVHDSGPNAAGAVTAVSLERAAGRAELVIGVIGDVEVADFSLSAPHRIVVDIKNATLRMVPKLYDGIKRAGITGIRVAQTSQGVVRIVMDVDQARDYQVAQNTNDVRVAIDAAESFEPWNVSGVRTTPPAMPAPERMTASAPPASPPVSVPPASITTLKNLATVPVNAAEPPQQVGGRITVSFVDTDLRDMLQVFAEHSGRSIITAVPNIKINAEIRNQPWQSALNAILEANGLAAVDDPLTGIISVNTRASLQARLASERVLSTKLILNYAKVDVLLPIIQSLLSSTCGGGQLQVVGGAPPAGSVAASGINEAVPPMTAGASGPPPLTAQQQLQPTAPPTTPCTPRGRIVAEPATNSLVIYETESNIDSLVAYVQSFDMKPLQVNIKGQIISINNTKTNRLGLSYDLGSASGSFNTLTTRTGGVAGAEFQVALGGDAFAGVANATRNFKGSAATSLIYNTIIGGFSLTSFLDALAQEELSTTSSDPSVNTLDKVPATLFVGNTQAFLLTPQTAPGAIQAAAPQIQQIQAGVRLQVTPSVSANRTIRLRVVAEQSAITGINIAGPSTSLRNYNGEIIVRDGETAVISGLTQEIVTKNRRGIPLLSSLPMIGRLFSENESIIIKDDLLILITPHILDDPIPGKQ